MTSLEPLYALVEDLKNQLKQVQIQQVQTQNSINVLQTTDNGHAIILQKLLDNSDLLQKEMLRVLIAVEPSPATGVNIEFEKGK